MQLCQTDGCRNHAHPYDRDGLCKECRRERTRQKIRSISASPLEAEEIWRHRRNLPLGW